MSTYHYVEYVKALISFVRKKKNNNTQMQQKKKEKIEMIKDLHGSMSSPSSIERGSNLL